MAARDLDTAEGMAEAIGDLDPDFHGLLERKEVSQRVQGRLSNANVKSISRFAALGDTRADLRTFCTGTLALDRAVDVVEIAGVVDAWQAGKTRMESRHQAEAEASISSMPNPINKVEAQDLRVRFEQMHIQAGGQGHAVVFYVGAGVWSGGERRVEGLVVDSVSVEGRHGSRGDGCHDR